PSPAPPPASGGGSAVSAAMSVRGTPYRWGGESPGGFDCSGLVVWSFRQAGRGGLPHSSRALVGMGRRISVGQLVPGDLVAYGSPVHHIGIYIGGGQYVHAPHTGDVVKVSSIYRGSGSPIALRI
ncbi:MAG: NlpC/P60 family protein, partial [Candidatus Microthrix parvicella]